jgi:ketosteroid isomerase-like protein
MQISHWLTVDQNSETCTYISGSGRATKVFIKNENGEWNLIHEHFYSRGVTGIKKNNST